MKALRILLVEDDKNACAVFSDYADTLEDVKLVGVTNNAEKAVQDIADCLPHAVILDLELHGGGGSGLDVLQGVKELAPERKPFFLITTVNTSNAVYDHARSLGADYILYKNQEGYSEKYALDLLRSMSAAIQNSRGSVQTTETAQEKESRIQKRIKAELYKVGVSPKMKGFDYLLKAIELYINSQRQNLSDTIARECDKSKVSVERAMQNAIDKAWKTTDVDELVANFKAKVRSDKGVPTIMEFVCYYGDLIGSEY